MSIPAFSVGVAFPNNPFDLAPTFTELMGVGAANYVESLTITRGRQTEDDAAQTGNVQITLLDTDDRFDINNAASPYYPNLLPVKTVRVQAVLSATTYPLFYGWADPQDAWQRTERDAGSAGVLLPANDGFELLSSAVVGASWASGFTGAAIKSLIETYGGWPSTWEAIDTGVTGINATSLSSQKLLDVIRQIEVTEGGFFFFGNNGFATFKDRAQRSSVQSSVATFCDAKNFAGGRILIDSWTTRRSKLFNDSQISDLNGTLALSQKQDAASQAAYRIRSNQLQTRHATQADQDDHAQAFLNLHKDPYETLESITLVPGTDDPTWVQYLQRELGDRITVVRTPAGGSSVTKDYYIEQITQTFGPGTDASCTWRLSPANQDGWLSGIAGRSEAGTTTIAGY